MPKRGRLTLEEGEHILRAFKAGDTPQQIATHLNRTIEAVTEYIKLNHREPIDICPPDKEERIQIREELRASQKWKRLKQELTPDELKYFEEEYVKLMSQFKGDVLATEESQIFDFIRLDVLKSRNMVERRRAREDVEKWDQIHDGIVASVDGELSKLTQKQRDQLLKLETRMADAREREASRTTEYVKLQERLDRLMLSLKGTRDQRIKEIENSKVNFLGVLKMLQDREMQEREARQMELMNLAGKKEYGRLGRPHKYEDGNEDSIILSADTVDLGPAEEGTACD